MSRKNDPVAAYDAAKLEAIALLRSIEAALESHDRKASGRPGGHNWGHVGDLGGVNESLRDLSDRLNGTGEYAS